MATSVPRRAVTDPGLELRLEPGRLDGEAINLVPCRDGEALPSISLSIPVGLRALVREELRSDAEEADLRDYLDAPEEALRLVVETAAGSTELRWDPDLELRARTRLRLDGRAGEVGVVRALCDVRDPSRPIVSPVRIGRTFAADLSTGRLGRVIDRSGWQVADLLLSDAAETTTETRTRSAVKELAYETEESDSYDPEDGYVPSRPTRSRGPSRSVTVEPPRHYESERERRLPIAYLNEKALSFPSGMREAYLKDLMFEVDGGASTAGPRRPEQRIVVWRRPDGRVWARCESALDGKPYEGGQEGAAAAFLSHLEFRSAALSRKSSKERCRAYLLEALEFEGPDTQERLRREALRVTPLEEAAFELEEAARRFRKAFAGEPVERLRASREGFYTLTAEPRRRIRSAVLAAEALGGDVCDWTRGAAVALVSEGLYERLRRLYAALSAEGYELWWGEAPVRRQALSFDLDGRARAGGEWFEARPRVVSGGRAVPEEEWRRILADSGLSEVEGRLMLVDDKSLETLRALAGLMPPLSRRRSADDPVRIDRLELLDWVRLRSRGVEITLPAEDEARVQRLLRFERIEPKEPPSSFRGLLRDYQKTGYDWLAFLYEHRLGACLADDMGLGKTVQAIAFLGGLKEGKIKLHAGVSGLPHLLVVPPTLIFNWKKEIGHFCPSLSVVEWTSGALPSGADVVIISYETLRRQLERLKRGRYHTLIFDEAQYLKNIRSERTSAARSLRASFRLTLTGTPLENHLGEFYSVMDLALPGLLGEYETFRRADDAERLERLRHRARPFVLRRTKDTAARELPPKTEQEIFLPMSKRQRALYDRTLESVRSQVKRAFVRKSAGEASLEALAALTRLRQICVSPRLFDRAHAEPSPKTQFLVLKLRELLEEEGSALVFSQFTSFLDEIEEALSAERIEYLRMDGTVPASRRKALVESYQSGASPPVFLISLRTGGVGLNLTRANHVFHLDPWWNPAVEDQASDRAHRIGQKNHVFVTRLIMRGTLEERILQLKSRKAELAGQALGGTSRGTLGREDLEFLLG
ncbi:MAG: hypothetical protein MOGMAGMI_01546 [Candidatus Omnitrophica bacterium]|nr:hypothetical protein [Candidatus Omnitrophota bacterium]